MDSSLSSRCLSLDLEVGKQDRRIHAFAAVRPDVDQPLVFREGDLVTALAGLDKFADDADFLLGHNLIDFDLPHLKAAKPDLQLLKLPTVDTLRLNPLIEPARQRMKTGHPISIDRARAKNPPGGDWSELDSVAQGRVQVLPARRDPISQARVAMTELQRPSRGVATPIIRCIVRLPLCRPAIS